MLSATSAFAPLMVLSKVMPLPAFSVRFSPSVVALLIVMPPVPVVVMVLAAVAGDEAAAARVFAEALVKGQRQRRRAAVELDIGRAVDELQVAERVGTQVRAPSTLSAPCRWKGR